jgi:hypothetical protein
MSGADEFDGIGHREQQKAYFDPALLAKGKKKRSSSNQLASDIIKYVKLNGGAGRRVNTQGQWDEERQIWRPSGMKRGFEDVDAIMRIMMGGQKIGLKVAVEIKIGKDSLKEEQKERRDEVLFSGGVYMVAKTFDQFKKDWDDIHKYYTQRLNGTT